MYPATAARHLKQACVKYCMPSKVMRCRRTAGSPSCSRMDASSPLQMTTRLLLPPAAATSRLSAAGLKAICHVSDGGVSMTHFVLLSCATHSRLAPASEWERELHKLRCYAQQLHIG